MGPRVRRLLHAVVLVPLLVFAVSTLDFARFLCSMDGGLRDRCCCPSTRATAAQADTPDTIGGQACCELLRLTLERAPTELQREGTRGMPALALVAVAPFALTPPVPPPAPPPAQLDPRPPGGPPLIVLKRSFLI